jgi:predicted outer membrane protein
MGWIQANRKGKRVTENQDETVFREAGGKARWLIQHADELDEDQRALLLAMVELDKEVGRTLTEEEHAALDKLAAEMRGFDPAGIQGAVQKMVEGEAKRQPVQDWPTGLGRKAERAKKK